MLTLAQAQKMIAAAQQKATELGVNVSVAVVDEAGIMIAFARMDNSIRISPRLSFAKAYTSATVGAGTADMAGFAGEGKPYYGVTSVLGGDLTTIAGGLPVMLDGALAGGVGVGGSMDVNQDLECAKAAVAAVTA